MADELRSCRRTGCRWPAAASLSYRYDTRQVWLLDFAEQAHPTLYDLCPHHADHLTLPRGWHLVDQRTTPEVIVEPAAVDRAMHPVATAEASRLPEAARAAAAAGGSGAWSTSRYAALVAELPKLAASLAGDPDLRSPSGGPEAASATDGAATASAATAGAAPGGAATPEGADAIPRAAEVIASGRVTVVRPRVATGEHGQVAGQLAIPVDQLPPLGSGRGAVVVSIQRAGGRRREARDAEL